MALELPGPVEQLRQDEYTGANRCVPCTAVNLVIAVVVALAVGIIFLPAGAAVFALSLATIYLRGYLVPGTPALTKRYFPDWLLAKFDKEPLTLEEAAALEQEAETGLEHETDADTAVEHETDTTLEQEADAAPAAADESDTETSDEQATAAAPEPEPPEHVDPEHLFLEHEILVPCPGPEAGVVDTTEMSAADEESSETDDIADTADTEEADLCLTADVETMWQAEIDTLRDGDREEQLAEFLETDAEAVELETSRYAVARVNGRLAARWESEAAVLADIAAKRVLAERLPEWDRLTLQQCSQLANGLRAFIETCPTCESDISLDEETVESCCRSRQIYAITCNDCGVRVLEVSQ
ncbi:hypothetical protein G6M89_13935 [Natronolimnobius sp. AArcel1]|uniref:hypothetical protein n=1 Tax=Natronolimnobius sp. AArcel1 TaxID=1679093 RepID=UPI0013ED6315|nr:hypothetical protein [Natronolimnobius sp. AArcel1]NGM70093.1 hypothetical protein [Natronolimnobius sp. AArcel1]